MATPEDKKPYDWRRFTEKPLLAEKVQNLVIPGSAPCASFFLMMVASSVIATLGLLVDSAAVIIGAMIIAPLMNPIISTAFGLVSNDYPMVIRSSLIIVSGSLLSIAIAYVVTESIGYQLAGPEIIARMRPSMLDLDIALAAGAAAAYAMTRPNISPALAGIAIAVALVPPLCTVGIALALDREASVEIGLAWNKITAEKPFILYLTNLLGIIFSATLVFYWQYFRTRRSAIVAVSCAFAGLLILIPSLTSGLDELLVRNKVHRSLLLESEKLIGTNKDVRFTDVSTAIEADLVTVRVNMVAPPRLIKQEFAQQLQANMTEVVGRPVAMEVGVKIERVLRSAPKPGGAK